MTTRTTDSIVEVLSIIFITYITVAISSVIIVGAILAAGPIGHEIPKIFGLIAVTLASVNIFGGFIVTYRMLSMFKKKPKKQKTES